MKEDLVSVVVLTYNSSPFVCETLDSIFDQDYTNLEIVVSDDGSKDDTLDVVKSWFEKKGSRFERCELVETSCNTGIPANCNRGIAVTQGRWIKIVAGDDILLSHCVSTCVNYSITHKGCNALFSRVEYFKVENGKRTIITPKTLLDDQLFLDGFNKTDAKGQFFYLLKHGCFIEAPTTFFSASFIKAHPYIEKYKYEDDYPLWLNLTRDGYKLTVIPVKTILYRRGSSLSSRIKDYYSRGYMNTRSMFFWDECYGYYKTTGLDIPYNNYRKTLLKYELAEAFTQNKRSFINNMKVHILNFLVNKFAEFKL